MTCRKARHRQNEPLQTRIMPAKIFAIFYGVQKGQAQAKLAIADQDTASIHIYDARGGSSEPAATIQPHRAPVFAMRFNSRYDTVISADAKGKLAHCTCPAATLPVRSSVDVERDNASYPLSRPSSTDQDDSGKH